MVRADESLAGQGIKNNSTLMAVKVITHIIPLAKLFVQRTLVDSPQVGKSEASQEAMNVVSEQRKMLEEIKADAARLGQKDATKDDHFLQVVMMFINNGVFRVTVRQGIKNTTTDNLIILKWQTKA